jgi:hypothetical protein
MSKTDGKQILDSLDELGLALADEHHLWTRKQKRAYEKSVSLLKSFLSLG